MKVKEFCEKHGYVRWLVSVAKIYNKIGGLFGVGPCIQSHKRAIHSKRYTFRGNQNYCYHYKGLVGLFRNPIMCSYINPNALNLNFNVVRRYPSQVQPVRL